MMVHLVVLKILSNLINKPSVSLLCSLKFALCKATGWARNAEDA